MLGNVPYPKYIFNIGIVPGFFCCRKIECFCFLSIKSHAK